MPSRRKSRKVRETRHRSKKTHSKKYRIRSNRKLFKIETQDFISELFKKPEGAFFDYVDKKIDEKISAIDKKIKEYDKIVYEKLEKSQEYITNWTNENPKKASLLTGYLLGTLILGLASKKAGRGFNYGVELAVTAPYEIIKIGFDELVRKIESSEQPFVPFSGTGFRLGGSVV